MQAYAYKSLEQSLWEMLSLFRARSEINPDVEPGSILRTTFEAVGFQVEDLTYRFDTAVNEAIPEAVYEAFGFPRQLGNRAQTTVRFTRNTASTVELVIPQGYRVARLDGFEYQTLNQLVIHPGRVDGSVTVEALQEGAEGNSAVGTITRLRSSIPTLQSVTNTTPALGGRNEEDPQDQQKRFALFLAQLHRSTHPALAAYAFLSSTLAGEGVTDVRIVDRMQRRSLPPGIVQVIVDNGSGTISDDLVSVVQSQMDRHRAAGAYITAFGARAYPVDMSFEIDGAPEVQPLCEAAAVAYLNSLGIAEKFSYENAITALTNAHERVNEVTLLEPTGDIFLGFTDVITPGTIRARVL